MYNYELQTKSKVSQIFFLISRPNSNGVQANAGLFFQKLHFCICIFFFIFDFFFRELHLMKALLMDEHVKQLWPWRVTIRWSQVKRLKKAAKKMLKSSVSSATRALMFKWSVKMSFLSSFLKGSNKPNESKIDLVNFQYLGRNKIKMNPLKPKACKFHLCTEGHSFYARWKK